MEGKLNSEGVAAWLATTEEAATGANAARAARSEAATKIAAATEAEFAFNKSVAEAKATHATARALDDAVKAKVEAGEDPSDDLFKREAAEQVARGAAFDVVAKSEVAANLFTIAAEATRIRASAEVTYIRAVSASEIVLDDVVSDSIDGMKLS